MERDEKLSLAVYAFQFAFFAAAVAVVIIASEVDVLARLLAAVVFACVSIFSAYKFFETCDQNGLLGGRKA